MAEFIGFKSGKEIEWIELNLLKNFRPLSKSEITSLASEMDESAIDSLITELSLRSAFHKNPIYKVEGNRIIPNYSWKDIPEYFLCLYYSYYGANDFSGGTKLFELISANALKNFINGEIYTLGFPSTKGFNDYLHEIAASCHEAINLPADGSYKDDGVDVVGYKLFGDNRGSNLYVLLQCAAGKHWTSKNPIILNRWTNYIIWFPNNIIQSISTVEHVNYNDWDKRASTFGMLIDRTRIYNFLYQNEIDIDLRNQVTEWVGLKLASDI